MIKVIAKIDFTLNGTQYITGDEIEVKDVDKIIRLNELGYIEPLTHKDIVILERKLKEEKEKL